jgi:hypothetical protein
MDYTKINSELAKAFGKGNVEVRPSPDYDYVLWFRQDNPGKSVVKKATAIVNRHQPTRWHFSKRRHVEN